MDISPNTPVETIGNNNDFVVISEIGDIPCLKSELINKSSYFQSLFLNVSFNKSCMSSVNLMFLNGICLEAIIVSFSTKSLVITEENVAHLIKVADFLICRDVLAQCKDFLENHMTTHNAIEVHRLAVQFRMDFTKKRAHEFLLQNLSQVSKEGDIKRLELVTLCSLLQSEKLVDPELDIIDVAVRWLESHPEAGEHFLSIAELLRFGLVDENALQEHTEKLGCLSERFNNKEAFINFMNMLENVRRFKQGHVVDASIEMNPSTFTPRMPAEFLISFGGFNYHEGQAYLCVYDKRCDRWSQLYTIVHSLDFCGLEFIKTSNNLEGKFAVFGGVNTSNTPLHHQDNSHVVDAATGEVDVFPQLIQSRNFVSSVKAGNKIFAIGGKGSSESISRLSSVEMLDLDILPLNWVKIPPMHSSRSDASAVVYMNQIIVVGGFDGRNSLETMEIFDINCNKWLRGLSMRTKRTGHCCVIINDDIYAIGGNDGNQRLNSMEKFSMIKQRWVPLAPMSISRSNFCAGCVEGKIVVAGGFDGLSITEATEIYDPDTNTWRYGQSMPYPNSGMAFTVIKREDLPELAQELYCYSNKKNMIFED